MAAAPILASAREFPSVAEAVADCSLVVGTASTSARVPTHPVRRLEYGTRLIKRHIASQPAAILFGSEKTGLSNDDLSHCHWLMHIPTRQAHQSMNLGQAVAVCLYELIRDPGRGKRQPKLPRRAAAGDLEILNASLIDILEQAGYTNARTLASTRLKVRRLTHRMNLSAHDASVWLGILRQIEWRIKER
jgi:tRNA/rRNA methyltransferase